MSLDSDSAANPGTPQPGSIEFDEVVTRNAVARFKKLRAYIAKLNSSPVDRNRTTLPRTNDFSSRSPRRLGDVLDDLGETAGIADQLSVTSLTTSWPEIVGPELADHLSISSFDQESGKLQLAASSTAWATQVRMLVPVIQSRIDDSIGAGVVREITVAGPNQPSWKHGRRSVPGRGPRDTYG